MSTKVPTESIQKHMTLLELDANGTAVECVVLKHYPNGDKMFIRVDQLDEIDKVRLRHYLSLPQAVHLELWDLLSTQRLGNGMNALEFFHQQAMMYIASTRRVILPNAAITGVHRSGPVAPAGQVIA